MIRSALAADGTCIACGSSALVPRFRVSGEMGKEGLIPTTDSFGVALADIVRCQVCGHMQLERMPEEAKLSDAYGEATSEDYLEEETGQRATARALLERIEAHAEIGALVDLGCWVGFLLDEARSRGWKTVGVEPSEFAAGYATAQLGLDVRNEDLFDAELGEERFNAVFMGDVIEHIPAAGEAVERAGVLLSPGGVLAMALPDAGSRVARVLGRRWWSVIPTHVHYFTRNSMARLLSRHGFEIVELRTAPKAFTVRYYLSRAGGYREGLGRVLVASAERLGAANHLWAPDFRDRMLVIARRV
jgi:SAM-dependent methyltransferase